MDITQLRYFVEVARYGSTQEAANALFISRQCISRSILHLEKEIKHDLFIRSKEGMTLSEAGKRYLVGAQKLIDDFDALSEQMKDSEAKTKLRVCFPESMRGYYQDKIDDFECEHKNCALELISCKDAESHNMLDDEKVDMIISWNKINDDRIICEELTTYEPYFAISNQNPLSKRDTLYDRDLCDETVIYYADGYENYPQMVDVIKPSDIVLNDITMVYSMVHKNKGIFPMPLVAVEDFLKDVTFVPLKSDSDKVYGTYAMVKDKLHNNVIKFKYAKDFAKTLKEA